MRSFELIERGGPRLVHFAAVNDRNGFFLLSREPRPRFAWSDLVGRTVISFGGAPTPWLCMQAVLRRHGVDPARVTFIRDLSTPDAVATFRAGKADFLEHGPPVADQLIADGAGHLVASMGEATGPVPFSSFMATPQMLRRERDVFVRFVRGLHRAQRWMAAATAAEIAAVIAPAFAEIDARIRVRAVERYLRQSTWVGDPVLTRAGFEALQEILLGGGFITRRHRFEDLVDTALATHVVSTMAG
jgi:NitT/TauT family transport system substrate-binding protein